MTELVERIVVPFEGPGAGAGPLTWGQRQVWAAMVEIDSSMSMGGAVAATGGRTVEDYAAELRFFMCRYAAMRTLLRFAGDGTVTQEVFGSGETSLVVIDTADGDDPATVAEALAAEWRDRKFDYATEWPLRMGVVRRRGDVTHVVALMCHIAADLGGVAVMMRDLAQRDPVTGEPAASYDAPQPLDLVRLQQEPAMTRQTATAMRYWETHLRAIPASLFDPPADPPADQGQPPYCRLRWQSRAMHLASGEVSTRFGADPAWVLLAAFAAGLERLRPGRGPFVAINIIGNRFRTALRDVVSPVTQDGLCVLDVAGVGAEEAIARARAASMSASKHAYYDPAARAALTDRVSRERGEHLDLTVLYNDRRTHQAAGGRDAAPAQTRVLSEEPLRSLGPKLMIVVEDVPDVVRLSVDVKTAFLPLPDLRALLGEMEAFVLEAATRRQPVA
ncbi:condensation domain-containing protein [Dactylosporangium sp. NPDC005555]|uniref:condensation domain-containing protein n=1 Tax=Dactylosporangium sp. NPDC005555 TaxID=3154889 RepID=UPI0033BC996D